VVTVKASQKIFTDNEVANLTGICVDHLHNFARPPSGVYRARCGSSGNSGGSVAVHLVGPYGAGDTVSALHALSRGSPPGGRPGRLSFFPYRVFLRSPGKIGGLFCFRE